MLDCHPVKFLETVDVFFSFAVKLREMQRESYYRQSCYNAKIKLLGKGNTVIQGSFSEVIDFIFLSGYINNKTESVQV